MYQFILKMKAYSLWFLVTMAAILLSFSAQAKYLSEPKIVPPYDLGEYDKTIQHIFQTVPPVYPMKERISRISQYFLGKPYLLGALGEGYIGEYDQSPLYRTDAFDCLTYVSTVMALAFSNTPSNFVANHKKIQYQYGEVRYRFRNHFTNLDWNANNKAAGYITEVTKTLHDENNKPIALLSRTYIDKKTWYRQKRLDSLKLLEFPSDKKALYLLSELQNEAERVQNTFSDLYYIPLTALFDANGNPQKVIFDQIPDIAIIEIVRPNWDLRKTIGTRLDISHLGFAIRKEPQLLFQHASQNEKKVVEQPLDQYLKGFLKSPTIKGIAIYGIQDRAPDFE